MTLDWVELIWTNKGKSDMESLHQHCTQAQCLFWKGTSLWWHFPVQMHYWKTETSDICHCPMWKKILYAQNMTCHMQDAFRLQIINQAKCYIKQWERERGGLRNLDYHFHMTSIWKYQRVGKAFLPTQKKLPLARRYYVPTIINVKEILSWD